MIQIKRGDSNLLQIEPLQSSNHIKKLMGDDRITLVWEQAFYTSLSISDYIIEAGTQYKLNSLPTVKKLSSKFYQYNAVFESPQYDLLKVAYMFTDGGIPEGEFSLTGNANTFIALLCDNLNRIFPDANWNAGSVIEESEFKTLTFSFENCYTVLSRLADEYETEWSISGNIIHLKKVSTERLFTLRYSRTSEHVAGESNDLIADNANLYDIERVSVDSTNIVTRLYPYGSDKNIPANYRGGAGRLMLHAPTTYIDSGNVAIFGIIEATKQFEAVYPRLELLGAGTITDIYGDEIEFTDTNLDFDVNDCLLDGVVAKVHFLTGPCAGYDCQIKHYDTEEKTFTIIPNVDDKDFKIPNVSIKPEVGNKYVLLDIVMPPEYIEAAEDELLDKANDYLSQNDKVKVSYRVTFSQIYARLHTQAFECGDTVTVFDAQLGVNEPIRIVQLTRNMARRYDVQLELSNSVSITTLDRITADIEAIQNNGVVTEAKIKTNSLAAYRNAAELRDMVFDPDGYFDPQNIRPLSIETAMLSVGSRSQSFQLSCTIKPNYGGNSQVIYWTAGVLAHFTISATEIKVWSIPAGNVTLTGENTSLAMYIYAKCSRTTNQGVIELNVAAIKFDSDSEYWYFLVGILHSPISDVRGISLTYGQTTINGQFIQTGVIRSLDGDTYFDLNNGEIGGNIKFTGGKTIDDYTTSFRNYLRKSRTDNLTGWSAGGGEGISVVADTYFKNVVQISRLSGGGDYQKPFSIDISSLRNTDIVYYAICKDMNGTGGWNFGGWDETFNTLNNLCSYRDLGNGWKLYYKSFAAGISIGSKGEFGLNSVGGIWRFYAFGVCKGTIAPADWSAAPEDIDDETEAKIISFASDGILTPAEKREIYIKYQQILAEHSSIIEQSTALSIDTYDYEYYYDQLVSYMNSTGILNDMANNSTIDSSVYKSIFTDFFSYRDAIVYLISSVQNTLIDSAISDGVITPAEKLQIKILRDNTESEYNVVYDRVLYWSIDDSGTDATGYNLWNTFYTKYNAFIAYLNGILEDMSVNSIITPSDFKTKHSDYQTAKYNLVSFIDNWQADIITNAISLVNKVSSDGFITPAEKRQLKIQWDYIVAEKPGLYNQGLSFGLDYLCDTYDDKYSYLETYINSINLFANYTTIIDVVAATFRAKWTDYYQAKEALKAAINLALGVKITAADYLTEAMEGSTDVIGGLLLTNLLLMKSSAEAITGGMSGLKTDPVGLWVGGTYEQAESDVASDFKSEKLTAGLDNKLTGAGHRAKGNLAWNELGDVFMKGAIEAISGRFGDLIIDEDDIISGSIKITKNNVPSIVSLLAPSYTSINRILSWTGEPYAETQSFSITTYSTIEFYLQSAGQGSGYGWAWEMYKLNSNSEWELFDHNSLDGSDTKDFQSCKMNVGTYYLKAYPYNLDGSPTLYLSGIDDNDRIDIKYYESKAVFANDGFYNVQNRNSFIYFKRDDSFHVMQNGTQMTIYKGYAGVGVGSKAIAINSVGITQMTGSFGLRVTTTGIQKTSNGGSTWTNI